MINTYNNNEIPCGFCVATDNIDYVTTKEDYLEFKLDGNDTQLFIRETSLSNVKAVPEELEEEVPQEDVSKATPPTESDASTKQEKSEKATESIERKTTHNRQLNYLYNKKWSGKTYFEEEIRKLRMKEYQKNVEEGEKWRKIWKQFQREMKRDRKRDLVRSSGPEWWQEPSDKQIHLALKLGDVINADYEEEVTGRTRQWLLDLGVTVRFTPKDVRRCMKLSLLNPIDFLLEVHTLLVKTQLNVKKKKGDLERPFSINERIILSAVCVLQLPTLLTMLHYILPPPPPYDEPRHIQELIFGDLCDERVRYSTPYMEPLPFRDQHHFHNWAYEKVFTSLLPTVALLKDSSQESLEIRKVSLGVASVGTFLTSLAPLNYRRDSTFSTPPPSVCWLLSECVAKRIVTESVHTCIDEDSAYPRFFSRRLTELTRRQGSLFSKYDHTQTDEEDNLNVQSVTGVQAILNSENTTHTDRGATIREISNEQSQLIFVDQPNEKYGTKKFVSQPVETATTAEYQQEELNIPKISQDIYKRKKSGASLTRMIQRSISKDQDFKKYLSRSEDKEAEENKILQHTWNKIRSLPKKRQLQEALKLLAELGDPLAQLPRIHMIPSVQRWLEMREGKNRVLSKQTKDYLLNMSRGMWTMAPVGSMHQAPKLSCSKRQERLLTWDRKNWLDSKVKKATDIYNTRLKQEKVDNARSYFPTMLNHYDHGSRLNRTFRSVFFTYLPAREADTLVYKPWQPHETGHSKS